MSTSLQMVHQSTHPFFPPYSVNKTPKYFSFLTWRGHSNFLQQRTMASDLEVQVLSPTAVAEASLHSDCHDLSTVPAVPKAKPPPQTITNWTPSSTWWQLTPQVWWRPPQEALTTWGKQMSVEASLTRVRRLRRLPGQREEIPSP